MQFSNPLRPIKLTIFFLLLSALTNNSLSAATPAAAKRPNILFAFADDWGRYASAYAAVDGVGSPNDIISTPHFDRVAKNGVLFKNAFVTAPSCTPCRTSLMSGQYFYRTGLSAILQGAQWDSKTPAWPLMLNDADYHIGKVYKVWSPGTPRDAPYGEQRFAYEMKGASFSGFSQTATKLVAQGKSVAAAKQTLLSKVDREFSAFLKKKSADQPFCYWFGPTNVHRKWIRGSGKALWNLEPDDLAGKLPEFLPDVPLVREDFADYLGEAMAFDAGLGVLLNRLKESGELQNTIVIVSGDHGAPGFPRGKCNLYDFGVGVPLAIMWAGQGTTDEPGFPAGRVVDDFVNLMDLAPTILESAGIDIPAVMTGRSLVPVLKSKKSGQVDSERTWVVTGRERHVAAARTGGLPYPQRALRTREYLYIVNFEPDRWPMGIPGPVATNDVPTANKLTNNTFVCFGDLDASPTKAWMIAHRHDLKYAKHYQLGFAKRPRHELYVLKDDPDQVRNVAGDPAYANVRQKLHMRLLAELQRTNDPRLSKNPPFESPPFTTIPGRRRK